MSAPAAAPAVVPAAALAATAATATPDPIWVLAAGVEVPLEDLDYDWEAQLGQIRKLDEKRLGEAMQSLASLPPQQPLQSLLVAVDHTSMLSHLRTASLSLSSPLQMPGSVWASAMGLRPAAPPAPPKPCSSATMLVPKWLEATPDPPPWPAPALRAHVPQPL
mgnify:CR=1 FL=1